MGRTEPCHGVLDEQAHRVSSRRVQLKRIPVEDAREMILQICTQRDIPEQALPPPWVHPEFGCAYAAQSHVLVGAPQEIPKCENDAVFICHKHYKQQGATTVWLAFDANGGRQARRCAPAAAVADVHTEVRACLRARRVLC